MGAAALSYGLFFLRGVWMLQESPLLARRWVRFVPHVNDTVLLGAAIALMAASAQYPWTAPWLLAKVTALALYILIGMVALHSGSTRRMRAIAWIVAQVVFFYIVGVAVTRRALVFV
jgi:uncharacterized membrane protein SirB2